MSKKDLASVTTDLAALASSMPTQRPAAAPAPALVPAPAATPPIPPRTAAAAAPAPALKVVSAPKVASEDVTQFSLSLRKSLRKQLASLAADSDMTMRAFVLNALKEKGLAVREDDLADLRKDRR